ncbi:MAG: DUF3089 domain-containing protein [Bacteroidia bacterium]
MKLLICFLIIALVALFVASCRPLRNFDNTRHPSAPIYSDESFWFALPWRHDIADTTPAGCTPENQANAQVDVFYVHPTLYFRGPSWNADLNNKRVNKKSGLSVQHQATAFNGSGKIYAPRYRQAVLKSFFKEENGKKPLDLAYEDIKSAFKYYLDHWNKGRPIVLVGHSQGARHIVRLLKDFFDGKELQKQLVVAYPIGIPFKKDELKNIPLCSYEKQTGCYVTWNTFLKGAESRTQKRIYENVPCVNPLTMKADEVYAPASMNKGGVTFKKYAVVENVCDAQVHGNVLWINKPKHRGFIKIGKSYHLFDINLFYMNLRENVALRVSEYLKK